MGIFKVVGKLKLPWMVEAVHAAIIRGAEIGVMKEISSATELGMPFLGFICLLISAR
jgi:hypothetical protein